MFSHGNKSQEKQFRVGPKTSLNFAKLIPMKPRCSLPIAVNESWIEVLSHGIKMHTAFATSQPSWFWWYRGYLYCCGETLLFMDPFSTFRNT